MRPGSWADRAGLLDDCNHGVEVRVVSTFSVLAVMRVADQEPRRGVRRHELDDLLRWRRNQGLSLEVVLRQHVGRERLTDVSVHLVKSGECVRLVLAVEMAVDLIAPRLVRFLQLTNLCAALFPGLVSMPARNNQLGIILCEKRRGSCGA